MRLVRAWLVWLPAALAGAIAGAIVLISLMSVDGLRLPFIASAEAGVVQNYVLFTHVEAGPLTVTTGTEYASTSDMSITKQWCYLRRQNSERSIVEIAVADQSGAVTYETLSPDTYAFLGLDAAAVRALAGKYCRFI